MHDATGNVFLVLNLHITGAHSSYSRYVLPECWYVSASSSYFIMESPRRRRRRLLAEDAVLDDHKIAATISM